jgi:hypothetical protein
MTFNRLSGMNPAVDSGNLMREVNLWANSTLENYRPRGAVSWQDYS